jgi:hypothetical protein
MAAAKLGMVQGLLAEVRAKRVSMAAVPAPSFKSKSKAAAPASKGGSRSAAVRKAWQTRKG